MRFFVLTLLIFLFCLSVQVHANANGRRVMVWLCLEFCGESELMIARHLSDLKSHSSIVTAVSFEKYTLGPNMTLVSNNLTVVSPEINLMGLESWPMLSSYPHPSEFIDWMREVFKNPEPFISSCILEAGIHNYFGYNLDWEPTEGVETQDAVDYANFIDLFARELNKANVQLTVDIATWSPLWNYSLIAATSVNRAISMGTYTSSDTSFTNQLSLMTEYFPIYKIGIGLESVNATTSERMSLSEVQWRVTQISKSGAEEIDIWRMPIPPLWWPLLESWLNSN